jgi:predicted RNA binding protein YcfA (HicA-like mRNA interferase family)
MTTKERLRKKLMEGKSDKNFSFKELCTLVEQVGFTLRRGKGSHSVYHKDGVTEIVNLQPSRGGKAKPYQVRELRVIVLKYRL